jgi:hypothetical protein
MFDRNIAKTLLPVCVPSMSKNQHSVALFQTIQNGSELIHSKLAFLKLHLSK